LSTSWPWPRKAPSPSGCPLSPQAPKWFPETTEFEVRWDYLMLLVVS
jgi:hypothetical protein